MNLHPPAPRRTRPVRVMAVDEHAVFRAAARQLVAATDGFEHVGEAARGADAAALAAEVRPDLVLVDVRMPNVDGIETARRIVAAVPGAVVVLVSVEDRGDLPASVASAAAAAHVRKQDLSPQALRALWLAHGAQA